MCEETKVCTNPDCIHKGEPQQLSNFYRRKLKNGYGRVSRCADCCKQHRKEYRKENLDKEKEYKEKYNSENNEAIKEYRKDYRQRTKDHISKYNKDYMNAAAKYDQYYDKISFCYEEDEIRRDPKNQDLLQVRCKNAACREWFNPINRQMQHRVRSIDGKEPGDQHLYCSDECKETCAIYGQTKYPKGFNPSKSGSGDRPGQAEFREMVIDRDGLVCEKCGKTKEEHPELTFVCHHIIPVKVDPIQSADIDNGIILCEDCHNWIHANIPGCGYLELSRCVSNLGK